MERILCAATWIKNWEPVAHHNPKNIDRGVVLCGIGHAQPIYQFSALTGKLLKEFKYETGFITTKNRFVNRIEGAEIFTKCGGKLNYGKQLYSEDLLDLNKE